MPPDPSSRAPGRLGTPERVVAVVVVHDGRRYLPQLVAGLASQERPPDAVIAVDTGSTDGSADLLAKGLPGVRCLRVDARTGFGAAVRAGLAEADGGRVPAEVADGGRGPAEAADGGPARPAWLWLLHDDCAPRPGALAALLAAAAADPEVALWGPKLRAWPAGERLAEVGVTLTRGARRETGLETGEFDQGQHDTPRDVLAVNTAGLLIRRVSWDDLGGLDPALPLFGDDVDLGWRANRAGYRVRTCPAAVVHHAAAATAGERAVAAVRGRPGRVARSHAVYVRLANGAGWALPLTALAVVLGSAARAAFLLLGKLPGAAFDELCGTAAALGRPVRLLRGWYRRRAAARVPARRVARLLAPRSRVLARAVDAVATAAGGFAGATSARLGRSGAAAEPGPVAADAEELAVPDGRPLLARPGVLVVLAMVVLAAVAARGLYGAGVLQGGALQPAPGGAADLWARYLAGWHPQGLGSDTPAPPWLAVVAALATVLVGKAWLAVDVLVLFAPALAAATAYLFLRAVVRAWPARVWGAAAYGLLPATSGALAQGRLGSCVTAVLLPLLALAAWRALAGPARSARRPGWSATFAAGLLLAAVTAFTPVVFAVAVAAGIVATATLRPLRRTAGRVLAALAVVPVLLGPWTPWLARHPRLLLAEAGTGVPGLPAHPAAGYQLLLGHPGGPGGAPWWLFAAVLLAALLALLRLSRARPLAAGWVVVALGLAAGVVTTHVAVRADGLPAAVSAWPGAATLLVGGGLVGVLAVASDGVLAEIRARAFGWRQPVAGLVAGLVVVTPLAGAAWWVARGSADPVQRRPAAAVPAYLVDLMAAPTHPATLLVRPAAAGGAVVTLLHGPAAELSDRELGADQAALAPLRNAVAELLAGEGGADPAAALARYGVGAVYLAAPTHSSWVTALTAAPGLSAASAPAGSAAFAVTASPVGRLVLEDVDRTAVRPLPTTAAGSAATTLRPGPADRRLVLAAPAGPRWQARLDGRPLTGERVDGWAQGFAVPAAGGRLTLSYTSHRGRWLLGELVALVVVGALALPGLRPRAVAGRGPAPASTGGGWVPGGPAAPAEAGKRR